MQCSRPKILRMTLDILLYTSVCLVIVLAVFGYIVPPYVRVSCNDPSIKLPVLPDTISDAMLICFIAVVPFIMMTILEWAAPPSDKEKSPLRQSLRRSYHYLIDLVHGIIFMYFINEVGKVVIGEPRPTFWTVCSPNITSEQCQQPYVTVTWKDCTNPLNKSRKRLVNSMRSFPSGHASVSVFVSVYMIVYIKQRFWNKYSRLLAPWLQLMWATFAIICCQSRIWDNQHHWWDVFAGGLLGGFGALLVVMYFSNWFIQEECFEEPATPGDPSHSSHTSVKRLISTTSESDNHVDHRLDNRELSDINGTP